MNSIFVNRIIRACKLETRLYEEVEADKSATAQAAIVVVLSIMALGVGTFFTYGSFNVLIPILAALAGWFVTSLLIYFVGAKLFPDKNTQSNLGELLRTIGFLRFIVFDTTVETFSLVFISSKYSFGYFITYLKAL